MNAIRIQAVSLLLLAGVFAGNPLVAEDLNLVDSGKALAHIVSNGHVEQAGELQKYLARMSGARIPVDPASVGRASTPIVLAVNRKLPGTSDGITGDQAYRIACDPTALRLTGKSQAGLTYAVYGLLHDHLGVRFLTEDVEVVPGKPTVSIPVHEALHEPAFGFRGFRGGQSWEWLLKNRGGGRPDISSEHTFYRPQFFPPDKYFDEHPDWYPLVKGKRITHRWMPLDFTSESLIEAATEKILDMMSQWESEEFRRRNLNHSGSYRFDEPNLPIPFGQGDGFVRSEDEETRALVEKHGSEMAPLLLFLNRILENTSKVYPDKQLITFAYFHTLIPPKDIKPHENLWIQIVSSAVNMTQAGDQMNRIRDNPRNADYALAIREWPKLAPGRVYIWEWASLYRHPNLEWPNILEVADNIKFYHEHGIDAVKLQVLDGDGNWGRLREWVWAQLMWDPDQDPEALVQEFLRLYYGPAAAPHLWEFMRFARGRAEATNYKASVCRRPAWIDRIYPYLYDDEAIDRMSALLAKAERAAAREGNADYIERVNGVRPRTIDILEVHRVGRGKTGEMVGPDVHDDSFGIAMPDNVNMGKVRDPRDGSWWFVPGGREDMPARIDRLADQYLRGYGQGAGPWFYRHKFLQTYGGPLAILDNGQLAVDVLPNRLATIKDLRVDNDPRNILFGDGYKDDVAQAQAQIWHVERAGPKDLALNADLEFHKWHKLSVFRLNRQMTLRDRVLILDRTVTRRTAEKRWAPSELDIDSLWSFRIEDAGARLGVEVDGKPLEVNIKTDADTEVPIPAGSKTLLLTIHQRGAPSFRLRAEADSLEKMVLHRWKHGLKVTLDAAALSPGLAEKLPLPQQWLEIIAPPHSSGS